MSMIHVKDVWEMFEIRFVIDGKVSLEKFWALRGVSFDVDKGEALGIIGENGAGKSTILKIIAGMLKPDRGESHVFGKVSGLLELGAGFETELTGKENIYLNSSLFGLNQNQVDKIYADIINFADIGKFIYAPVKCYSQGMLIRLAFAIAIHIGPDILLIDDTLAVGDEYFQARCIKRVFELKEQGKTIVVVTHDMSMLKRLCNRAIFLKDGRVIKDGESDKVISFYSQMIGAKETVGVLEKEHLCVIFNNGRMLLSWNDRILTCGSGVYTVFSIAGEWHTCLRADWHVKKENDFKLVAIGRFLELSLTQTLTIELDEDHGIKLDIDIESQGPHEIKEMHVNILLTNKYERWFTPLENGGFPLIDETNKNWLSLINDNELIRCIGVEVKQSPDNIIPTILFEKPSFLCPGHAQILNSDYLTNCRVLQYKISSLQNFMKSQNNNLRVFSGRIIVDIPDMRSYLERMQNEFVLSSPIFKLIFNNGQGRIFYHGFALTKPNHLCTSIFVNKKAYSSVSAHWSVEKQNNHKLVAKGIWQNLPITEVWEFEKKTENTFLWKIYLQIDKDVEIEEHNCWVMCHQDYEHWFTEYTKGVFPEEFSETQLDMTQKCIHKGIIGLQSPKDQLCTLSLKFSEELGNFAKILNSDFYAKARVMRILKVYPEQKVRFQPGKYRCFETEIILNKDIYFTPKDLKNTLQEGELKFVFDNGRGRLYWRNIELTKRLGIYTSLRSKGRWYDSLSSALWDIEEAGKDSIKVSGKWLDLPIKQYWKVEFSGYNTIELSVTMRIDEAIEVERLQTNIMLSERYSQWFADNENGTFSDFKGEIDDDWEVFWSNSNNIEKSRSFIGVLGFRGQDTVLPGIKFFSRNMDPKYFLNVLNSDLYHRGRVLQNVKAGKISFIPEEYPYFKGQIIIEV